MVHIPTTNSAPLNAQCPHCGLVFGYVEKDGQIACPGCGTTQKLPVIHLKDGVCYCTACRATFPADGDPACLNCGAKPLVTMPTG